MSPLVLPDVQNTKNGLIQSFMALYKNLSARLMNYPASCSLYSGIIGRKRPAVQSGLFLFGQADNIACKNARLGEGGAFLREFSSLLDASASEEGERIAGRRGMHLFSRGMPAAGKICGRTARGALGFECRFVLHYP